MRAAIYARVSSAAQRERHTIESQLRVLPEYVRAQGWQLVETYVDDGRTAKAGKLAARSGFAQLTTDMVARRFDVVVVVAIDRLTRSEDQTERGAILGAFQRAGVQIAVVGAGLQDLGSFAGDAYVTLQALFAAEENRKRRERTVSGKVTAIGHGRKPAGPTPYGYRYARATGTWSLDETEAEVVREIYRRVAGGEGTQGIARDLTERGVDHRHYTVRKNAAPQWERSRVYTIATRSTYRGQFVADKRRRLTIPIPAIVDDALWYAAQDAIRANGRRGLKTNRHVYLLQDLAVCEVCGARINIASALNRWSGRNGAGRGAVAARYVCARRAHRLHGEPPCTLPYLPVAGVDQRVWEAILRLVTGGALERAARELEARASGDGAVWEQDLADAQTRLGRLAKVEEALLARFRRGTISATAMDGELEAIGRERALLEHQVAAATRARDKAGQSKAKVAGVTELVEVLRKRAAGATLAEQRALVEVLLPRGSVALGPTRIVAKLQVQAGALAGSNSRAGRSLTFRLVA